MSNESVIPSNHLILCCPHLILSYPQSFPASESFQSITRELNSNVKGRTLTCNLHVNDIKYKMKMKTEKKEWLCRAANMATCLSRIFPPDQNITVMRKNTLKSNETFSRLLRRKEVMNKIVFIKFMLCNNNF